MPMLEIAWYEIVLLAEQDRSRGFAERGIGAEPLPPVPTAGQEPPPRHWAQRLASFAVSLARRIAGSAP
jgi:hypothetical protein